MEMEEREKLFIIAAIDIRVESEKKQREEAERKRR
jgi:hypothetical protein